MQILDLCVGKPYTDKASGQDKKRWVKVGAMFINHDEQGNPRYSMKFDAYPTGDVFISAFEKKENGAQPAQATRPATTPVTNTATAPDATEKVEDEIKLWNIPF